MNTPIPFQHANNIPIVGQAFTFKAWFPTVQIQCNCEAKEPVLLTGIGTVTQCPACRRGYTIGMVQFNAQTGQNQIGIGVAMTQQEKEPS